MLRIQNLGHLAGMLQTRVADLSRVSESKSQFIEELLAWDPERPEPRPVLHVQGELRVLQQRLLREVFMKRFSPASCSFGGVRGRNIVQNAAAHLGHEFLYLADISRFYPSISNNRVNRFFLKKACCSPDVACLLTKLCTHDHHLALGLVTSPLLADQILRQVDLRILGLCKARKAMYSRFVDDIAVSANYDIQDSGIPELIEGVLADHGFHQNHKKSEFGRISSGIPITRIRLSAGHPDVDKDYISEVDRRIADHVSLANGGEFQGPLHSREQLSGKINFICWVNPLRRLSLTREFVRIRWWKVREEALRRKLVIKKRCTTRPGDQAPWTD